MFTKNLKLSFIEPWICKGCGEKNVRFYSWLLLGIIIFLSLILFVLYNVKNRNNYKRLEKEFSELKELKETMPHKGDRMGDEANLDN